MENQEETISTKSLNLNLAGRPDIAEGCGKNSNQEFVHFLNIASGSANESEYFLIPSKDLNYLNENTYNKNTYTGSK